MSPSSKPGSFAAERAVAAAQRLLDAECALYAAIQAHGDAWIAAAADKLHTAVEEHLAAVSGARGERSPARHRA